MKPNRKKDLLFGGPTTWTSASPHWLGPASKLPTQLPTLRPPPRGSVISWDWTEVTQVEIGPHLLVVSATTQWDELGNGNEYGIKVACGICGRCEIVSIPWRELEADLRGSNLQGVASLLLDRVQQTVIYWVCATPEVEASITAEKLTLILAEAYPKSLSFDEINAQARMGALRPTEMFHLGSAMGFVNVEPSPSNLFLRVENWRLPDNHPLARKAAL